MVKAPGISPEASPNSQPPWSAIAFWFGKYPPPSFAAIGPSEKSSAASSSA
jgi:hypothetical protein